MKRKKKKKRLENIGLVQQVQSLVYAQLLWPYVKLRLKEHLSKAMVNKLVLQVITSKSNLHWVLHCQSLVPN